MQPEPQSQAAADEPESVGSPRGRHRHCWHQRKVIPLKDPETGKTAFGEYVACCWCAASQTVVHGEHYLARPK
jgi:hypothetical protein